MPGFRPLILMNLTKRACRTDLGFTPLRYDGLVRLLKFVVSIGRHPGFERGSLSVERLGIE